MSFPLFIVVLFLFYLSPSFVPPPPFSLLDHLRVALLPKFAKTNRFFQLPDGETDLAKQTPNKKAVGHGDQEIPRTALPQPCPPPPHLCS